MDNKQSLRYLRMKSLKKLMVVFLIAFLGMPFLFWKDISQFNTACLTIFITLNIAALGVFLGILFRRYKKIAKEIKNAELQDKSGV